MSYAISRCVAMTAAFLTASPAGAQTYAQLADLDPTNSLGPRLTATVASNKLNGNHLFAAIGSKITLINAVSSPPVAYEFASDPMWNRVLFGQKDVYIYQFKNAGGSLLPLEGPGVSTSRPVRSYSSQTG